MPIWMQVGAPDASIARSMEPLPRAGMFRVEKMSSAMRLVYAVGSSSAARAG